MFKPVNKYRKIKKQFLRLISKKVSGELVVKSLSNIHINKGDHIFVHSSLSKFGNVVGGGEVIIDSLIEGVGSEGTVLFPGFTIMGSASKTLSHYSKPNVVFDVKSTIPSTGILCRIFKEKYAPKLSVHPTHSIMAKGKLENHLTEDQHKTSSAFGVGTPFVKLMEADGKIVGMGSDFGHVTFFHVLEDLVENFPVEIYEETKYEITCILENGETITEKYKAHRIQKCRIEKNCGTYIRRLFWNKLKRSGKLQTCKVGSAKCWSVSCKDLYYFIESEMQQGRTIYSEAPNNFLRKIYLILGWFHEVNR